MAASVGAMYSHTAVAPACFSPSASLEKSLAWGSMARLYATLALSLPISVANALRPGLRAGAFS